MKYKICAGAIGFLASTSLIHGMTSNNYFDALPIYSTANPHEFLYDFGKDIMRGLKSEQKDERFNFTITPFGQRSKRAKDIDQEEIQLGNIHGLWNMLALTYTTCPTSSSLGTNLAAAAAQEYACNPTGTDTPLYFNDDTAFTYTAVICNTGSNFGQVEVPAEYRRYGVRFETAIMLLEDLGFKAQFGVSDLQFTVTAFRDNNGTGCGEATCEGTNQRNVYRLLTSEDKIHDIASEIGLNINNFHKTSFEDMRLQLFWRHAVEVNQDRNGWSQFLFMPFIQLIGTIATGPEKDPSIQFAVSHGNNGHHAFGINTGFTLDFDDRVEIGFEAGGTVFMDRTVCNLRIPNHKEQSGIFPCTTTACISPGANWHFLATIHARHFLRRLSFFIQYAQVNHQADTIRVADSTLGFIPSMLEKQSKWNQRYFLSSLHYDISPNVNAGILWQAPLSSNRNAPRIGGLYGTVAVNF
ncbi:hypothetical protein JW872_03810 [Candidatus Babeliales bacterium]|nr:hypothetical protein [Candidatus Babeliales bacterium]